MNASESAKGVTGCHRSSHQREAVLIVACGDGWIEAYAERHVDIRIELAPFTTTPEGEQLAEEYLGLTLPKRYRDLYWPGLRRAAQLNRVSHPIDIAWREWELELLQSLRRVGERLRGCDIEGRLVWTL